MPSALHPRFGSLAAAVRAGCELVPDPASARRFVGPADAGRVRCDALAAAWLAEYSEGDPFAEPNFGLHRYLSTELVDAYPLLRMDLGPGCPAGPESLCPKRTVRGRTLEAKIAHLQDEHEYSRETVANWLRAHSF